MRQGFAATASQPVIAIGTVLDIIGHRSRQCQLPPDDTHIASASSAPPWVIKESTCIDRSMQASATTAGPHVHTKTIALNRRYNLDEQMAGIIIEPELSACHHGLMRRWS
jgi:hypothetical protein